MKIGSLLVAGIFAAGVQLLAASPVFAVDISITENFNAGTGQGSYTVANNSAFSLKAFGVSNPDSTASVKFHGSTFGCEPNGSNEYCYESFSVNEFNWETLAATQSGPETFQDIFGDFALHVESGENSINWYYAVDGDLLPGATATDFFLFEAFAPASIALGILGGGGGTFSGLTVGGGTPAIPLPAALPLYGTGLAVMGFMGWRRKRKAQMA